MKTTFKTMLLELGDSSSNYEVIESDADSFKTKATINKRVIVFSASMDDPGEMHIEFWELKDPNIDLKYSSNRTYGLSGSGGEIKVLSMIGNSIKEAVARYHPPMIFFTAEKEENSNKRADIYEKLLKKFLPGYEAVRTEVGSAFDFQVKKK